MHGRNESRQLATELNVLLDRFVCYLFVEVGAPGKKGDWVADVLPEHDRASDDSIEVIDR